MLMDQMILTIEQLPFVTIPLESASFHDHDVIYIILGLDHNGQYTILDVGESPEYGAHPINTPERRASWLRHSEIQQILVGIHRLPSDNNMKQDREKIINKLRQIHHTPCGDV